MDEERFKIIRRNSLRNEVDGSFEELEAYEDRNEAPSESNQRRENSCESYSTCIHLFSRSVVNWVPVKLVSFN